MRIMTFVILATGLVVSPGGSRATVIASQHDTLSHVVAIAQFEARVAQYMALRQDAAASVAVPRLPGRPQQLLARTHALAMAIRARRPAARPGDIFTASVRGLIRLRIAGAMVAHHETTARMIARAAEDLAPCDIVPEVNEPFPWQRGAMMPPYLIAVLPALPAGLQYRIVDRDLVLLDLDANLVVDILKDALPPPD